MRITNLSTVCALSLLLAACDSGDVSISAPNNVTAPTTGDANPPAPVVGTNPCASYSKGAQVIQGAFAAPNCEYGIEFVSAANPLILPPSEVVIFKNLTDDGVHIFDKALVVGRNYEDDSKMVEAGITQGGDGARIQIDAGATLAFKTNSDYLAINRGSQIIAEGTKDLPITVTSYSDAVDGSVGPEDVQQWGGMVINGTAVTNKCAYVGVRGEDGFALTDSGCSVAVEGLAGTSGLNYGGDNDGDNSGVLKYFRIKHAGAEVAPGNELNGITFNAVGSGTTVSHIQVYSSYDDGIEFFGGSVNVDHYVGLYVRDDTIDIDEGYDGTIKNALAIHSESNGNHCVESDGIGSFKSANTDRNQDFIARGLNSKTHIENLTCIIAANEKAGDNELGTATHGPGRGIVVKEGHFSTIKNSIVTTAYKGDVVVNAPEKNACYFVKDDVTREAAVAGDVAVINSVFACQDIAEGTVAGDKATAEWLTDNGNTVVQTAEAGENPTTKDNAVLVLLDGYFSLPIAEMIVGGGSPNIMLEEGEYLGAVLASDDWTEGWTFGLDSEDYPLWFLTQAE